MKPRPQGAGIWLVLVVSITASMASASAARAAPSTAAPAKPSEPSRADRLLGLARIWAEVKFFHPAMFQRAIDWDSALTKAIPEVEAANDAASYRVAIGRLLAGLSDPRTTVEPDAGESAVTADWRAWAGAGVLVLNARLPSRPEDYAATRRLAAEVRPEIAKARVVVVDLRGCPDGDDRLVEAILPNLPATTVWPTMRSVEHYGFRSQGSTNRKVYRTSWAIASAGAPTAGATPGPMHVVFAVDPRHALPVQAVALWASGRATLVSPTALDDSAAAITKRIALPYGLVGRIRTADVVVPGNRVVSTDVVTGRDEDVRARAIAVASSIASGATAPRGPQRHANATTDLLLTDDDDAPQTGLPARERRLLAAIKVWAVIEYFHGTRRLDRDWDQQLRAALPRVEAAGDHASYTTALAEMLLPIGDGHGYVRPRAEIGRRAFTAIYWRRIDGKIVAGGLRNAETARAAGIALGDELVSVGGIPVEAAVVQQLRTTAGGNDEERQQWTVATLDRGGFGTTVDIETRSPSGKPHTVTMARDSDYDGNFWAGTGPHYRTLPGGIGYVDLRRLTSDEIDAMFDALAKTTAIVFDMRGYSKGTAWLIGARINTRMAPALAEIRTPLVTAANVGTDVTVRSMQQGLPTDKPLYRGKVVVLIDDRAISAAEHLCLVFEASGGATFIGSPTAGTNGEETYVKLPGGLEMRFTGMEILHADGRQLQQLGIQPHITVRPTLRGLRAGKDEVFERALRYLATGK